MPLMPANMNHLDQNQTHSPPCFLERGCNSRDGSEENERIVPGGHESASLPEPRSLVIDSIDHQGTTADQVCRLNAALKRMLHKTCADALPRPSDVCGKLAEKQAGNRIGRLPGADRAGQDCRDNGGWRQTVISDHAPGLMDNEDGGETLLLIGKRARLQPVIERRLATGKGRDVMFRIQRFRSR